MPTELSRRAQLHLRQPKSAPRRTVQEAQCCVCLWGVQSSLGPHPLPERTALFTQRHNSQHICCSRSAVFGSWHRRARSRAGTEQCECQCRTASLRAALRCHCGAAPGAFPHPGWRRAAGAPRGTAMRTGSAPHTGRDRNADRALTPAPPSGSGPSARPRAAPPLLQAAPGHGTAAGRRGPSGRGEGRSPGHGLRGLRGPERGPSGVGAGARRLPGSRLLLLPASSRRGPTWGDGAGPGRAGPRAPPAGGGGGAEGRARTAGSPPPTSPRPAPRGRCRRTAHAPAVPLSRQPGAEPARALWRRARSYWRAGPGSCREALRSTWGRGRNGCSSRAERWLAACCSSTAWLPLRGNVSYVFMGSGCDEGVIPHLFLSVLAGVPQEGTQVLPGKWRRRSAGSLWRGERLGAPTWSWGESWPCPWRAGRVSRGRGRRQPWVCRCHSVWLNTAVRFVVQRAILQKDCCVIHIHHW